MIHIDDLCQGTNRFCDGGAQDGLAPFKMVRYSLSSHTIEACC